MDYAAVVAVEIFYAVAVLVLISAGLAVIFGMMRVINLAHGEFLTLGGYAAIVSNKAGVNIYVSMLVMAPLAAAIFGFLIERRQYNDRYCHTDSRFYFRALPVVGLQPLYHFDGDSGGRRPLSDFKNHPRRFDCPRCDAKYRDDFCVWL